MAARLDVERLEVGTLVLTGSEVARFLSIDACIEAVETAFRLQGTDAASGPMVLELPGTGGGFHVKAGGLELDRAYAATKINANFPANPVERGLPTIQGIVLLFDAECGTPLAVLDSAEVTALRTAAATALAARHLARADASIATIVGCGRQSRDQLRFLCRVRPIRTAFAIDRDGATAARFASDMAAELGIVVEATEDFAAARSAQIWVTCTPSAVPVLSRKHVSPGAFVAGVGADSPHKRELAGDLFDGTVVVVDILAQCLAMGDLRHALAEGRLRADQVHGELGDILAGRKPGRRRDDEIIVFDSTGMALQDVAAAAAVYRSASAAGQGRRIVFRD
ncbi:MAG: ornithine cyclodeaminase family protein [Alphaproteobacteria bacterium]|nr:ornithine cyclodeaminase family protein [Alphaproteobacteria bacterium]